MHMSNDDYEALRDKLVGFYYSYWIAGYTASKIKQISFNIIGWIKNRKNIDEIIKGLMKKQKLTQYIKDPVRILIMMMYTAKGG